MHAVLKKWGNSVAVRIPSGILETASFSMDQVVDLRAEDGRIVIEPERKTVFNQAELVSRITAENLHDPVETGRPVGREAW